MNHRVLLAFVLGADFGVLMSITVARGIIWYTARRAKRARTQLFASLNDAVLTIQRRGFLDRPAPAGRVEHYTGQHDVCALCGQRHANPVPPDKIKLN
jgi:hypothetical protein